MKTLLSVILLAAALAGCCPAHGQVAPIVPFPFTSDYAADYISYADTYQACLTAGALPDDMQSEYTLGWLHGIVEALAETYATEFDDGWVDPPDYDSIPFVASNLGEYQTLASGYLDSAYVFASRPFNGGNALAYDAGFFAAVASFIEYTYTAPPPSVQVALPATDPYYVGYEAGGAYTWASILGQPLPAAPLTLPYPLTGDSAASYIALSQTYVLDASLVGHLNQADSLGVSYSAGFLAGVGNLLQEVTFVPPGGVALEGGL